MIVTIGMIDNIRALQEKVLCFRLAKHRNTLLLSSALGKRPDADSHNSFHLSHSAW